MHINYSIDMVSLHDRPLLKYLCEQNPSRLQLLYESPVAAYVVFRFLPSLSQQCLLKGLWQKIDCSQRFEKLKEY